jgi:beta-glucosidase
MSKNKFPKDFLWGAASASAQIEGGWNEGGRTPSIWDIAPAKRIKNRENCHIASDHYRHYKEDVALMKEIGLKSYRFSISWSRVIPSEGVINPEGIAFYSNLVDELKAVGIEPLVTLYHWDLPVWAHKKGGWKSKKIVGYFRDYAKIVVEALSDRVKYWMTMNEPQCFIMNGYMAGAHAPFRRDYLALSKLTRNCMFAHAEAVKAIRKYAKISPKVGIAMATGSFVPESEAEENIEEAYWKSFNTGLGLMGNRWWMDPILAGKPVRCYGIYRSRQKDMQEIHQPLDFVGVNVYQPFNIAAWGGDSKTRAAGLPTTSMGWIVDERVLYWTLRFVYERYKLPVMVTENGMADNDFVCLDGKVHDPQRTDFIKRYLRNVKRAVDEGIPVIGYQYWSVMDNFEWAEGYDPRFGLIFVDYRTGKRILKDSAYEYKRIIESNGDNI